MPFLKFTIFTLSSVLLSGHVWGDTSLEKKVDSIYQQMDLEDRINQLVWVELRDNETVPGDLHLFGGVYYNQPLSKGISLPGIAVAVQLDDRMNPLPEVEELPNLYTLAAITQSDILSTYLYFLKKNSKAYGIDFLVLPEADNSPFRKSFVDKIVAFDPDFFKKRSSLSFEQTKKKKHLISIFESSDYWVVNEQYLTHAQKGISRHADKIDFSQIEHRIKDALSSAHFAGPSTYTPTGLPNQLAVAISKASVVPLQRTSGLLPLQRDTISFITDQPFGPIANMLRKYVYVITAYDAIKRSESTIIIDNDAFVPADIIDKDRQMVFIGSLVNSRKWTSEMDAALIYTQNSEIYEYVIPQQLFGAAGASGQLPSLNPEFSPFMNDPISGKEVLGFAPPEMTGLDHVARGKIEQIISEAISSGGTPGCQLAIAVDGAIVLDEAYGYLTYDSLLPVDRNTLYDLASLTKVTATLLAVMKLYEKGQLDLDKTLGDYLPGYDRSNKKDITLRALLAHNAGLRPYVPFWQKTLGPERMETFYYETSADMEADKRSYGVKPTPVLADSLKNWILQSSLLEYDSVPYYKYSDIGFMILHQVVETISGIPLDHYLEKEFYGALGLKKLTFNPRRKGFDLFEIAPTEYDYYFRDELVWGVVHDRNAAVFGGVAGHAGLFSNATDLLVILQTMLQDGRYAGVQFLSPETIQYFNNQYFPNNRRALGWDKKSDSLGNTSRFCSDQSFGHTGFTGTMVWVDPSFDLIYVFLSNRIYPDSNNYKLNQKNIRTRIQDVVYEAILAKWMN